MQIDLVGRVRNTNLGARSGLMPLFEAVVNAVHAVQDSKRPDGRITVVIKRALEVFGADAPANALADITSFSVTDNGVGFTTGNYNSFDTMDSRAKVARGGKGIGRLLWLVAFDHADVQSIFLEQDSWKRRNFEFRAVEAGIVNPRLVPLPQPADDHSTEVRLHGFKPRYRSATVKSAEAIGRQLVEHCLEYFLLGQMPQLFLKDPTYHVELALHDLYAAEYRPESAPREFAVHGEPFTIVDVLIRGSAEVPHALKFCAHNRSVSALPLIQELPYLYAPLKNERGDTVTYQGYVTSTVLDERVDPARTGFDLDHDGELALANAAKPITWEDIVAGAVSAANTYLEPRTEDVRRDAFARVEQFIEREPQYRGLLGHKAPELRSLPGNLSDEKLDTALHRILSDWRHEVRQDATAKLQTLAAGATATTKGAAFKQVLGDLNEVAKSDLAQYVLHRATVLRFFRELLGAEDGKFQPEDALHNLFFPMRTTSDDVDFNDHNLWLLDERLAFHRYLASDLRFTKHEGSPVAVDSEDRPDVLVYNTTHAFATTGSAPFGSVVVVEFKKPERTAYKTGEGPIRQALGYVQSVRQGKARRPDGSTIDRVPEHVPFYCHVVATLTDQVRAEAEDFDALPTADGCGYFFYHSRYGAYVELSSYHKVLEDARKRNKAFFDKLKIPPHAL